MQIEELVQRQRAFYSTGTTLPVEFRMEALRKLKAEIRAMEPEIHRALEQDLGKSGMESYMCEVGMTLSELSDLLAHTPAYFRPHRAATPLAQFHASSFTLAEPYGVVLVMSPWNYPFMLTLEPLLGAIACGNCCVVKPSAYAPNTSAVIKKLIERCFPPEYVAVVEGGRQENQALLNQRFDYIFFTGGQRVGTEVLRHAAEYLTPVTLELGGKSPCVVDHTAKLDLAAKRIAFGKLLNCGQTCVAPDYFLVERSIEAEFIEKLKTALEQMVGKEPLKNYEALRPYVTRDTISKLKAMDKLDPDEYDVPDVDMFIKAQGYEDDWGIVSARALDYDAACMQVYISFGKKRDHTVIDCMVKEDGVWKVESVASMNISDNLMME